MAWRAPSSIGADVGFTVSLGDSVVLNTTVVVDGAGQARTGALPVGEYTYRISHTGEEDAIGSGRIESEGHTLELLRRPVNISTVESEGDRGRSNGAGLGPPLRTHPGSYLLILVLLSAEWIGRRRGGLR